MNNKISHQCFMTHSLTLISALLNFLNWPNNFNCIFAIEPNRNAQLQSLVLLPTENVHL